MKKSRIFSVYEKKGKRTQIFTKSIDKGNVVYGERIYREGKDEYREWDPTRSKLAAMIMKGTQNIGIRKGDVVLYLGASTGTTISHVSDIIEEGFVFGLDFAPRVMRELVFLAERRKNIAPIMADARQPKEYAGRICQVDVVFQDIAQRDQVEIFLKNVRMFLKKGGYALLALKARSVDVTKQPKKIYKEVMKQLEKELIITDYRVLDPYEKDHAMFICKK